VTEPRRIQVRSRDAWWRLYQQRGSPVGVEFRQLLDDAVVHAVERLGAPDEDREAVTAVRRLADDDLAQAFDQPGAAVLLPLKDRDPYPGVLHGFSPAR
jgi:hypothetical protein